MVVRTGSLCTAWLLCLVALLFVLYPSTAHAQSGTLPVYLWPDHNGYPLAPGEPIILLNPNGGTPVTIWPNDPHYPAFGQPMIVWPGDPLYSYFPSAPMHVTGTPSPG